MTREEARELFRRLAVPRLPGSEAVAAVERLMHERLSSLGFQVTRPAFPATPQRLYAGSVLGAGAGWATLIAVPLLLVGGPSWLPLGFLVAAGAATAGLVGGTARLGWGVREAPVACTNVVAVRGEEPALWLVAHSDSKAQRLSLAGRVLAVAALVVGAAGMVACGVARLAFPLPWFAVAPFAAMVLVGAGALSGRPLSGQSPGAVDNASGMLAVLTAAEALADRDDVGVLVTGAEEFGMVGAWVWVAEGRAPASFINVDGVDGIGSYNVMAHRSPGRTSESRKIARTVATAIVEAGGAVRRSPLPLGIFVDGGVLAVGGHAGVTVSRGRWATLRVIHTPRDTAERTDASAAVDAGRVIAAAARRLLG